MSSPALPLTPIVNVSLVAGPALGTPPALNQGAIIDTSAHIPTFGGTGVQRIRQYASLAAMAADGFLSTSASPRRPSTCGSGARTLRP